MELKANIKELEIQKQKALDDYNTYRKAIEALQLVCDHDYNYDGHGHNEGYYTCSICGKKETR